MFAKDVFSNYFSIELYFFNSNEILKRLNDNFEKFLCNILLLKLKNMFGDNTRNNCNAFSLAINFILL